MLDLDAMIGRHASGAFTDATPLREAGIDSSALLRLAVAAAGDGDAEIDASRLVDMRTIGDLKRWLLTMGDPC